MISYKALTRASITLQLIDDIGLYDSEIFSSNGLLLQPYDQSTTLTGIIYKNNNMFNNILYYIINSILLVYLFLSPGHLK